MSESEAKPQTTPKSAAARLEEILGPRHHEATLQGSSHPLDDDEVRLTALDKAFDYRGDVTLVLDGGQRVSGYIFDRRRGRSADESCVRLLTPESDEPVKVAYARIVGLEFTGRDAAHGKSWETWVRKFVSKKLGRSVPDATGPNPDPGA